MSVASCGLGRDQRLAWSVRDWCRATSLSRAFAYELLRDGKIASAKVGSKRLITTSPAEFLAAHSDEAAA